MKNMDKRRKCLRIAGFCLKMSAVFLLAGQGWAIEAGAEEPGGGTQAESQVTVKSDVLLSEEENFTPEDEYTDPSGNVYELKNWSLIPQKAQAREKKVRETVIYEEIERPEEILQECEITAEDEKTAEKVTDVYPLLDLSVTEEHWRDDFSFPVVFHVYDADFYELGGEKIPYSEEKPQLQGYEQELLAMIGAAPENYRITDIRWEGEPYQDSSGTLCRNAVAKGQRLTRDYLAIYGGKAVFLGAEAFCCEAVYGLKQPEKKPARDVVILPAGEALTEPQPAQTADGWELLKQGMEVTVTILLLLALLLLVILVIWYKQGKHKEKKAVPPWKADNLRKGWDG